MFFHITFSVLLIGLGIVVLTSKATELFIPTNRRDNSKITKTVMLHGLFLILWGVGHSIVSYLVEFKNANVSLYGFLIVGAILGVICLKLYIWRHYPKHQY